LAQRVIAVVPCRTSSARLPNKALAEIHGVPAIERCLLNVCAIDSVDRVVLATSTDPADDVLRDHTLGGLVDLVRGPLDDVLERFLIAIERHDAEHVVRVTGDCPLASFELADLLIREHVAAEADATYAEHEYASGTGADVYSAAALRRLRELCPETPHSEYLILYFRHNPHLFRLREVPLPAEFRSSLRLTLDEPSDLELLRLVFSTLDAGRRPVPWESVRRVFAEQPEAAAINAGNQLRYRDDPGLRARLEQATTIAPS
jgi:N,N'-diacetyllegionaminate synthase